MRKIDITKRKAYSKHMVDRCRGYTHPYRKPIRLVLPRGYRFRKAKMPIYALNVNTIANALAANMGIPGYLLPT